MKYWDYGDESLEESGDIQYPTLEDLPASTARYVWQGVSEDLVPFSKEAATIAQKELIACLSSSDPLSYICSNTAIAVFGSEIKRFLIAVYSYLTSERPALTEHQLVKGVVDINYAATLKELKTYALSRSYTGQSLVDDGLDKYDSWKIKHMLDVGEIFNYKYWLRWEEPSSDDWKYALKPVVVKEGIIEKFEETLRDLLPNSFPIVQKDEILLSNSSSSSRLPGGRMSKVFKDKQDLSLNTFSKSGLRGYLTKIQKGPCDVRDAITLTVSQSNTVKWIEKQMSAVAAKLPTSAYGLGQEGFAERLRKQQESGDWFYNRDLTKEGWTKPRWILKSIGKVMKEKAPDLEIWDYFSIFNSFDIYFEDGRVVSTDRGHGLGMANALTTIMQCALHQMVIENSELGYDIDAIFYNDDASFEGSESAIMDYSDEEETYLEDMGLIRKEKKTYLTRFGCLCESYYPPSLNKKDSYWRYVRRLPFASCCLLDAKASSYLCLDTALGGEPDEELFTKLVSMFGFEHSVEEYSIPWWAGGWYKLSYKGVDLTFLELEPSQILSRAVGIGPVQLKPMNFKSKKGTYVSPAETLYYTKDLEQHISDALGIRQPMSSTEAKYSRGWNRQATEKWFLYQLATRKKKWTCPAKPLTLTELYMHAISRYPWKDFIPPQDLRKEVSMEEASIQVERVKPCWPIQPNKLLGSLCYFQDVRYIQYVVPWPWIPGQEEDGKDYSIERLERSRENIMINLPMTDHWKNNHTLIQYRALKNYHWNNSYNVWEAWATLTGTFNYIRPTRLSVGAIENQKGLRLIQFADLYGSPPFWEIWTSFSRSIAILLIDGLKIFSDEELDATDEPFITTEVSDAVSEASQEEIITYSFMDWKYSTGAKFVAAPGLRDFFHKVDSLLVASDTYVSLFGLSGDRRTNYRPLNIPLEGSAEDQLIRSITKLVGTTVGGVYIYRLPVNQTDLWAEDGDDGGGALGDLFG